ncbi:MAG: hypothetical protein ACHQF0_15850, partial [Chitinophagales bacterium]
MALRTIYIPLKALILFTTNPAGDLSKHQQFVLVLPPMTQIPGVSANKELRKEEFKIVSCSIKLMYFGKNSFPMIVLIRKTFDIFFVLLLFNFAFESCSEVSNARQHVVADTTLPDKPQVFVDRPITDTVTYDS